MLLNTQQRHSLDLHWDAKLPHAQRLVVAAADKASRVVDEGDRVDSTQVVVVLL
jgi:hypothetical protein